MFNLPQSCTSFKELRSMQKHRIQMKLQQVALCLGFSSLLLACATKPVGPITINMVAINDLHGHLEKESFSYTRSKDQTPQTTEGGGIETLGANIQAWRKEDKDLLFVGGGDLIGASPSISSLFADEPTIDALGYMNMRVSALGNHEFDQGVPELQRQIHGGCKSPRPSKACQLNRDFSGAKFSYIAANVIDNASGKPLFPAYHVEQVKGVKIAFIGAVVRDTPLMVANENVAGLTFIDEAEGINRTMPELKAMGVKVFVVLIHEGGTTTEAFDQPACSQLKGPIVDIVKRLDPAIKLIISGHSHTGFICNVAGRTVTQAQMYGHLLTRLSLTLDGASQDVLNIDAYNLLMTPTTAPVPAVLSSMMVQARAGSHAIISQPIARVAVPVISRKLNAAGESPLGNVVADAQLAAVSNLGVEIAFMNNKGIRGNLETSADNVSTFGQNSTVLPFGNTLVVMSLTGAQIRILLEQQMWLDEESPDGRNVLQVSSGFSYTWDKSRPIGQRVIPASLMLNGKALEDAREYRVVANNFIAGGGDRVPMFIQGKNKIDTGIKDITAFINYLKAREGAGAPAGSNEAAGRVNRIN